MPATGFRQVRVSAAVNRSSRSSTCSRSRSAHISIVVLRFREPSLPRAFRIPRQHQARRRAGATPSCRRCADCRRCLGQRRDLALRRARARRALDAARDRVLRRVPAVQGKPLAKRYRFRRRHCAIRRRSNTARSWFRSSARTWTTTSSAAGRLAAEEAEEGEGGAVIEAIYVVEIPMSLPLDARVPEEKISVARRALQRAKDVGEEYEGVEVATASVRARTFGQGIVEEARRRGSRGDRPGRRGAHADARWSPHRVAARDHETGPWGRRRVM